MMHYYTFYAKDYASKTAFLEPMEDLAYRRMLDLYYLEEKPLPESIDEISILIRMRTHCDCIANVLRYFFELTASGYINKKAEFAIDDFHNKSAKAKASADARWAKVKAEKNGKSNEIKDSQTGYECNANALNSHCEMDANYKPITNNHKQNTKEKKFSFFDELLVIGGDTDLAKDYVKHRKEKKASLLKTGFDGFKREFEKSNLDVNTVMRICIHKSWRGFESKWLSNIDLSEYQSSEQIQDSNTSLSAMYRKKTS